MLTRRAFGAGLVGAFAGWAGAATPGIRARSAWGAAPARTGGRVHVATRIALHHTAGKLVGSAKAAATLRSVQAWHMGEKGWVDIAYHVFVDADGAAWAGRDVAIAGDTATVYDPAGYLLVCAMGNFEEVDPTAAQVEGIARVLAGAGLPFEPLALHRDLAAETVCPGARLVARVPEIVARARVMAGEATP